MLTASVTSPNPPQDGLDERAAPLNLRATPTPQNWQGVEHGLKDAAGLLHLHLYTQAEDTLLHLLEFAPMEGKAWHLLGRCHQLQDRHGKALECFDRAACCYKNQTADSAPPASARLARLLWDQGDTAAARTMLDELLVRQPDDAVLLVMQQDWQDIPSTGRQTDGQEAMA